MIDSTLQDRSLPRPFAGLPCPSCGGLKSYVIDVRSRKDGQARRRRQECSSCKFRYTTYEVRAEEYEKVTETLKGQRVVPNPKERQG